jgi:hypothetical protein
MFFEGLIEQPVVATIHIHGKLSVETLLMEYLECIEQSHTSAGDLSHQGCGVQG